MYTHTHTHTHILLLEAFDLDLLVDTLQKLKEGKHIEIPIYDFTTHARAKYKVQMYSIQYIYMVQLWKHSNRDSIGIDKSVLNSY